MAADRMEQLVSLCKQRGFIFPGSEAYGGLAGTLDYGPLGVALKQNIKQAWWKRVVQERDDVVGLDAAILMHPQVWEASGHVAGFSDPMVDCRKCKARHRADTLSPPGVCPQCGSEDLTDARLVNMMFKTSVGPMEDSASVAYLRPETAQGIFVDFPSVLSVVRKKLPFGVAQIGKAFRNEITPGQFLFRLREFEQMEVEYFVKPDAWEPAFDEWLRFMHEWLAVCGISESHVSFTEIPASDRAHYSKRTVDIEYHYPFGQKELYGLAYRTDYDLTRHAEVSKQDFSYFDEETRERFIPHVIEPSLGVDRTVLAVLLEAYHEIEGGRTTTTETTKEAEVVLKLPKELAPIKVAVLPLSKKAPLQERARDLTAQLRKRWMCQYDEAGSIGKRYRRQDEIGTPYCITVDFDTAEDGKVTIRDRDSMAQERVAIEEVVAYVVDGLGA
ncbi:MAG: glycine--tRNA ligase [bacterium]|nr:glycine--tRNA ligase [bacterium]